METGTALLIGVGAGLGAWLLLRKPTAPVAPPVPTRRPSFNPEGLYTGSDLGPLAPITSVPIFHQAYSILAPINDNVIQPFVNMINTSDAVTDLNHAIGGPPVVTRNPDGTITRTAPSGWYADNIGKPISSGVTKVFHALGF